MAAKGEAAEGALRAKMVKTVPSKPIFGYILQVATGARQAAEKAEMPQLPPVIFAVSYFQVVEVEGEVYIRVGAVGEQVEAQAAEGEE